MLTWRLLMESYIYVPSWALRNKLIQALYTGATICILGGGYE